MSGKTTPMLFQQESIDSAVKVLSSCLADIEKIRAPGVQEDHDVILGKGRALDGSRV